MTTSRCKTPLDPSVLAEYWLSELTSADEERLEEHLLDCGECSRESQSMLGLMEAIRDLTRKGLLRVIVSEPFLDKLRSEGLNIRQYDVNPGGSVACTITDQDDMVIARLAADLTNAQRVDISRCDAQGREQVRIRDVPLTGARNQIVFTEPTDLLRALGQEVLRVRLIAVDDAHEQVLGEYTFNHTPSA